VAEPGTKFRLELLGLKIAPAIGKDFAPDILMMPIPPRPPGVAMAAIVSWSTVIFLNKKSLPGILDSAGTCYIPAMVVRSQFARKKASQEVSATTSDLGKR
jgi:hypothetical protein